jgi:hypothetical protein
MRLSRLFLLPVAALGIAACSDDDGVVNNARPPLGGVRFINAVPDGGAVDIRMVDQIAWSAGSASSATNTGLPFRAATIHWATEAKARHIRVFPTDSLLAVTSQILHDTTITIEPNKNVTLMLVGSRAPGGSIRFVMIDDTPPALTGNQIAVRALNAGGATPVSAYLTATATTALPGTATWASMAPYTPGAYVTRDTGTFAVRSVAGGTTTPITSATAPAGAPKSADGLTSATAGFRAAGSALAAYVFPRACPAVALPLTEANCPTLVGQSTARRTALQSSELIFFIDRIPGPAIWTPAP